MLGKILTEKNDVYGEFIGMLKLSAKGAEIFKKHFHRAKKLYWGKKFQRAKSFPIQTTSNTTVAKKPCISIKC